VTTNSDKNDFVAAIDKERSWRYQYFFVSTLFIMLIFRTIDIQQAEYFLRLSPHQDLLTQLDQVYYWGFTSKTHKRHNYLPWILKHKLFTKVIKNAKLEGLGAEN
jgi:hypothetical protein